jgi:hypothetical protein
MIISHKYKFVFIKTKKVAGSSIEQFLYPYLDKESDIITGSSADQTPSLNLPKLLRKPNGQPKGHATYKDAADILGNKLKTYFIFTVERNPWQKTISAYKFHKSIGNIDCSLNEFAFLNKIKNKKTKTTFSPLPCDWYMYTQDNKIIVDKVIQFNNLHQELQEIISHLNIPADINDFLSIRLKQSPVVKYTLNDKSINKIAKTFSQEIKEFNYQYPP